MLAPSRRDLVGPPPRDPRDHSDLSSMIRHQGSYLRQLDAGIMGGRWATPRPVPKVGAQLVGGGDSDGDAEEIAFWNTDRATATTAGRIVLNLTFEPIDGSLTVYWNDGGQPPTDYILDVDAQLVTFINPHVKVGHVLWAEYAYYPTDFTEPDPSGWWRLDESSGVVMVDSSGNGHDGLYGGVTLGQASLLTDDPDTAAAWNGAFSHSQVPYASWMDTPQFSITMLCKGTSPGTLFCRNNGGVVGGQLWVFRIGSIFSGPGGELGLFYGGNGANWIGTTGLNLIDGARHMVGFSYDGTTLKLYADGVLRRSQAIAFPLVGGPAPMSVGANEGGTGGSLLDIYNGVLDEIKVYPKILTESEFSQVWIAS